MGASWADWKSKKVLFWSIIFSYSMQRQTISQLDCDLQRKWTVYDKWLSDWTKKMLQSPSQSQINKKKMTMTTVWWSSAGLMHYSFLNPSETLTPEKYAQQINEIHWKLQCWQLALVNRMGPILLQDNTWPHIAQPTLQKLNELGHKVLLHLPYSPDLSPADLALLWASRLFAGKTASTAGSRKCFPRLCWIPKHGFLCCSK